MRGQILLLSGLLSCISGVALAAEQTVSSQQRQALALTVYNHGIGLVTETRTVDFVSGRARYALADVAAQIRPETTRIHAPDARVVEQNFEYDLLTANKLLEKFVGQTIGLVRRHPNTDEEKTEQATLLSVAGGVPVFQIGDRIETGGSNSPWRYVFSDVPTNLRAKPTLTVDLVSKTAGQRPVQIAYLTGGLGWKADYVATLSKDFSQMELTAWVTLNNNSGTDFESAQLSLVAGELNQAMPKQKQFHRHRERVEMAMADAVAAPAPQREALADYYLYRMPEPTTVANNQTKQLRLLSATAVPSKKVYRLDTGRTQWRSDVAGQKGNATTFLQFENAKPTLGQPLPAGIVRMYQQDSQQSMQLLGEDRINHTATDDQVELTMGQAFDVTARRKQTKNEKAYGNQGRITAWEVELHNAKDEAVTVEVLENVWGDVKVLSESHPHERLSASRLRWNIVVEPKAKVQLAFELRQK